MNINGKVSGYKPYVLNQIQKKFAPVSNMFIPQILMQAVIWLQLIILPPPKPTNLLKVLKLGPLYHHIYIQYSISVI